MIEALLLLIHNAGRRNLALLADQAFVHVLSAYLLPPCGQVWVPHPNRRLPQSNLISIAYPRYLASNTVRVLSPGGVHCRHVSAELH